VGVGEGVGVGVGVGVAPGVAVGVAVGHVGMIVVGKIDGVGDGVGAMHWVPGKYSSRSLLPLEEPAVGDGDADPDGEMLLLFWQAVPSTRPPGRWKLSTLKLAWESPLLMKSRSTELPTIVP
jgi:hypothetical protein